MASLAHKDDYFESPKWLMKDIHDGVNPLILSLDLCASNENTKAKRFISEEINVLDNPIVYFPDNEYMYCNPPRSKNGKFVNYVYDIWTHYNHNIVMLLCWNDLGNKYGEKLLPHILNGEIVVKNLGKIKFDKNGIESEFPSRLCYFWALFKKRNT